VTFLDNLQSHRGGLIQLKTQLYWYDGVRNEIVGRICLILDAAVTLTSTAATSRAAAVKSRTAALLLIDGAPHWVWITEQDVELL